MLCKSIINIHAYPEMKPLLGKSIRLNNASPKGFTFTIDDGPSIHALPMLRLFKRHDIKASFFLLATKILTRPDIAQKIVYEGHDICVHGYDHSIITEMSIDEFRLSLLRFDKVAKAHNIPYKKIYRPPNGEISQPYVNVLTDLGYVVALWSLDSFDWKLDAKQILNHFSQQDDLHQVSLFHDDVIGGSWFSTMKALVQVIALCNKRNVPFTPLQLSFQLS